MDHDEIYGIGDESEEEEEELDENGIPISSIKDIDELDETE